MNRQLLRYLFIALIVQACANREVQLPETTNNDVTEITDISSAYIFYNDDGSADFNKNTLISTTNWAINVDKRLSLGDIMPHLIYLQDKRGKASMHKNDNAKNYFSCSNAETQNLSFIDVTDVNYRFVTSKPQLNPIEKLSNIKRLDYRNTNEITLNDTIVMQPSMVPTKLKEHISDKELSIIQILVNAEISFQDYINLKTDLLELQSNMLVISNGEIIYK